KDFYRTFRAKEKTSFEAANKFARECFNILPLKASRVHWRLYLEIADLAKRENRFVEARKLYRKARLPSSSFSYCFSFFHSFIPFCVTKLQPFASQGWLEYSQLEEECGDLAK
ncbi:unnamed protein product, partial [Discosporangium mesarthrocarpum]